MSFIAEKLAKNQAEKKSLDSEAKGRIARILTGANAVQREFILDRSKYKSLRCPRRSGKSFSMTSNALYIGESIPLSRILIISLTLKSTKENFWNGPGGIKFQNHEYKLELTFNETDCVWNHSNGSRGRLAGAETKADIEYLRGAAAEADIIFIDECKSFPPQLLTDLIRDVLEPGLMTRDGVLVLGGTPGNVPIGEFYRATQLKVKVNPDDNSDTPAYTCYLYDGEDRDDDTWSLHTWTVKDNTAKPKQWDRALKIKLKAKWDDNNPAWRREYLGEWVTDTTELVYSFSKMKPTGRVTWTPSERDQNNKTGLPLDTGPWHLIMGLDFGYEDMNAIVVAAYSDTEKELRHIYDFKKNHMTIDEFGREIKYTIDMFGAPDVIIGDKGSLGGVLYIQELQSRFGLSIEEAEKREKYDHIELLNSDFYSGRIKIIESNDPWSLDAELCQLQWDLSKDSKERLIRTGKLRENPSCPNHLCDALLYLWRYCYHFWATPLEDDVQEGSTEWYRKKEKESIEKFKQRHTDNSESLYEKMRRYDNVATSENAEYGF